MEWRMFDQEFFPKSETYFIRDRDRHLSRVAQTLRPHSEPYQLYKSRFIPTRQQQQQSRPVSNVPMNAYQAEQLVNISSCSTKVEDIARLDTVEDAMGSDA